MIIISSSQQKNIVIAAMSCCQFVVLPLKTTPSSTSQGTWYKIRKLHALLSGKLHVEMFVFIRTVQRNTPRIIKHWSQFSHCRIYADQSKHAWNISFDKKHRLRIIMRYWIGRMYDGTSQVTSSHRYISGNVRNNDKLENIYKKKWEIVT